MKKKRVKRDLFPYDEWQPGKLSPDKEDLLRKVKERLPDKIWLNGRYKVWIYENVLRHGQWPRMHWLSIKRRDQEPIREWRDLQRIKNDLIGEQCEGVELFPAESRLVDASNQYHMFVFADSKARFPFGYTQRGVALPHDDGSKQAPFEKEPEDAATAEDLGKCLEEAIKKGEQEGKKAGLPDKKA